MKQIFLYGISGAADQYRVVRYTRIDENDISIDTIRYEAQMMRIEYPNIEHVYAIDNRTYLYKSYTESVKKNSIESWAIFKDILERGGIKVY